MGASFSSTVTSSSYRQLKSLFSSTSFNNTTTLPLNQQSLGTSSVEPATLADIISATGQQEIQLVSTAPTTTSGSAEGDNNQAQDNSKPIFIAVAVGVATASLTLLSNIPPASVHILVLYKIYWLFLLLSLVLSMFSIVLIVEPSQSLGGAQVQKKALKIAVGSLVISVTMKIFLMQSTAIKWYDVLIPILLVGGIFLYLWYGWRKANNSRQTSNPALTSLYTSVE